MKIYDAFTITSSQTASAAPYIFMILSLFFIIHSVPVAEGDYIMIVIYFYFFVLKMRITIITTNS